MRKGLEIRFSFKSLQATVYGLQEIQSPVVRRLSTVDRSHLDFLSKLCKLSLTQGGCTLIIILGTTRETEADALRCVLGSPRYHRLSYKAIATHPTISTQPIIGSENIYRIALERANLAFETRTQEISIALGIQHGITILSQRYLATTVLALRFPDGNVLPHICGTVELDSDIVVEAHKANVSTDSVIARIFGTNVQNDPISTITHGRLSRKIILIESLKMFFATIDWSYYIRLSSAPA